MGGFASPSIRAERPLRGAFRAAEAVVCTLALGLTLVGIPGTPDTRLDASWQLMLIHAHAAGLQFGRDVFFTWGPWGFLCCGYHLGATEAVPILVWETLGQLGIAASLVLLTRGLAAWRRIAFVVLFMAFHWLFMDVVYFVLIALIVVEGLMGRDAPLVRLVGWTLVLGFLSHLKFTYLALAAAGVLAAMAHWAVRRAWGRVGALAAGYAAAVVAAWVAAGQNPDNLYPYLRRGLELSSAYGAAMGVDESWPVFLWGAAAALGCAAFLVCAWRSMPDRAAASCACGYLAFLFFAMWKESYTRADLVVLGGHVFGLFTLVLILAPVLPGLLLPGRRWHGSDLAVPYSLAAIASFDGALYAQGPVIIWQRLYGNAHALARLGALPQEWQGAYGQACADARLPAVQAAVGRSTVDVYDFDTAVALMNGLNLASRPVFQGYSALTPGLEGCNLRFYQSEGAPDYLLWNSDRIDDRYPGQDDAMLVAALPGHYVPFLKEGAYWLMRRTSRVPAGAPPRRVLLMRSVGLSQEVVLPGDRSRALWLALDPVPNALGRARAILYKPAELQIAVTDDRGRLRVWRLVPRVDRVGFLLAPTLATADEAAALLRGAAPSWVRSFHFESPLGQGEFWSRIDVEVSALSGVALEPPPDAAP